MRPLTRLQRETLALVAQGRGNREIAEEMMVSVKAVEGRMQSIYALLRLSRQSDQNPRVMAARWYLGLDRPPTGGSNTPPAPSAASPTS